MGFDPGVLLLGSALSIGAAFVTFAVVEWLRYRSYLRHRDSGDVPPTQDLVVKGVLIGGVLELLSLACIILWLITRR